MFAKRYAFAACLTGYSVLAAAPSATFAQIPTVPSGVVVTQQASLSEYLVNRLRATTDDQRDYIQQIVKLVEDGKLEKRLVLALERYARRRSPYFPLPIYERALRYEAGKRGVAVPRLQEIVARNGASAARAIRDSRFR
jgi:hypothetical protein